MLPTLDFWCYQQNLDSKIHHNNLLNNILAKVLSYSQHFIYIYIYIERERERERERAETMMIFDCCINGHHHTYKSVWGQGILQGLPYDLINVMGGMI